MKRLILITFVILFAGLIPLVGSAQTKPDKEYEISASDKAELKRLTKRFVARMQQTRDVGPLIPEFYLRDFYVLSEKDNVFLGRKIPGPRLSKSEWLGAYVASTNFLYLTDLDSMMGGSDDFSSIMPKKLGQALVDSSGDGEIAHKDNRGQALARLKIWEKTYPAAKAELRKRNNEGSLAYKKEWDRRIKAGDYDFEVSSNMLWDGKENVDHWSLEFRKRFSGGVRAFHVTSPIGLGLIFVRDRGRFRILYIMPYPWD